MKIARNRKIGNLFTVNVPHKRPAAFVNFGASRSLNCFRLCAIDPQQDNEMVDDQEQIAFERAVARELAGLKDE